ALPLLDGMVPALTAQAKTAAAPVRRLGVFYVPNGMAMGSWLPKTPGPLGEQITPTLASLAPYRDHVNVLGALDNSAAPLARQGGDHSRSSGCFLTSTVYRANSDSDVHTGVSFDQVAARRLGQATQLASIELTLDEPSVLGHCNQTACSLTNTISWRTETVPNQ